MMKKPVIVVSGLPRSGTSLMMQMLAAGGVPILTDKKRRADADNPRGYFEWEAIKHLTGNSDLLLNAQGKAVKIISHLLPSLPHGIYYKILFMKRNLHAVIQSQNKMLRNVKKAKEDLSDIKLRELYRKHLAEIRYWLYRQSNCAYIFIEYDSLLKKPFETALQIQSFLEFDIDTEAMVRQVDSSLNHFPSLFVQE